MDARTIITALLPIWLLSTPIIDFDSNSSPRIKSHIAEQSIEEQFNYYIEIGDLLSPIGACAYNSYQSFVEKKPTEKAIQRQLKRTLVANLVGKADQKLSLYFDQGAAFILEMEPGQHKGFSLNEYYAVAADLMGQDHYTYKELMAKSLFTEAVKLSMVQKDLKLLISTLRKSIAFNPSASYTYNELGLAYFNNAEFSLACEQYHLALQLNPSWKSPRQNLQTAEAALLQSLKK